MTYVFFLYKPGPTDAGLITQKSLIAKKLDIEDEDLLFIILELNTSLVSCFGIKVITKNMALF